MKKKLLSFLVFFLVFIVTSHAQGQIIKGKVTDRNDGSALPGVSITVEGLSVGTQTNGDGFYTINVPATAKSLTFHYIGMLRKFYQLKVRPLMLSCLWMKNNYQKLLW